MPLPSYPPHLLIYLAHNDRLYSSGFISPNKPFLPWVGFSPGVWLHQQKDDQYIQQYFTLNDGFSAMSCSSPNTSSIHRLVFFLHLNTKHVQKEYKYRFQSPEIIKVTNVRVFTRWLALMTLRIWSKYVFHKWKYLWICKCIRPVNFELILCIFLFLWTSCSKWRSLSWVFQF